MFFITCDEACTVGRHDGCNSRSISKVCLCIINMDVWRHHLVLDVNYKTRASRGFKEGHWGIQILNNYKHNGYYRCCHVRHEVCLSLQLPEWISSRSDVLKLSDHIFHPSPKLQYISIHNPLILIAVPLNVTFPIYGVSKLVITLVL